MALTHLLDTSVVKRLGRPQVRAVVEPLAAAGRLGRPGICDLEVGYSAYDADFDLIASVTGQPTQWVGPVGTVE